MNQLSIKISKKPIVILLSLVVGFGISSVVGMVFFDVEYTDDQKLTMAIQDKYPLESDLRKALDSGEITEDELSNELKAYMFYRLD